VRTNVEPDTERWRATLQWMQPRTHLLKISEEDLALLYPGRAVDDFAAAALAAGTALVVVTRGGDGALAFHASGRAAAEPVATVVVDTVGAGDTFQAALLTWLAEHRALSASGIAALGLPAITDALRFAARAAAITCSRRGADLPRRFEID
jgi:fructokinase